MDINYKVYELDSFDNDEKMSQYLIGKVDREYCKQFNKAGNSLIMDYGSMKTLGGYNISEKNMIGVYSIVNKNKEEKHYELNVDQFDILKQNYKQLMERDYINYMSVFELINDHMLGQLCDYQGIEADLLMSECMALPQYSRVNINEIMFEGYNIKRMGSVLNINDIDFLSNANCLQVHIGNNTTHILPKLGNRVMLQLAKRLNVGINQGIQLFAKEIQFKLNQFQFNNKYLNIFEDSVYNQKRMFTYEGSVVKIFRNISAVSVDYNYQLNRFKQIESLIFNNTNNNNNNLQQPIYQNRIQWNNRYIDDKQECIDIVGLKLSYRDEKLQQVVYQDEKQIELQKQKKLQQRKEQAERLRESIQKKRENKKIIQMNELNNMLQMVDQFQKQIIGLQELQGNGYKSLDDLNKKIKQLKIKLNLISKEQIEQEKFSLLNINDENLTEDQLKQKKFQQMQQQMAQNRLIKKQQQQQQKEKIKELKLNNPQQYLEKQYQKRQKIIDKINKRKKNQQEINHRKSKFNKKRMQTLAQLGGDYYQTDKNGDDMFGLNEEDWNIYLGVTNYESEEEEVLELKLNELENELREMDQDFEKKTMTKIDDQYNLYNSKQLDHIVLRHALVKPSESLFQPKLIGTDQMGISELILNIVGQFSQEEQRMRRKQPQEY